jgi:hypothetical protein
VIVLSIVALSTILIFDIRIVREESAAKHSTDDYSKFTSIGLKCFILLQVGGCVLYRVCRVDCFPVVSLQL